MAEPDFTRTCEGCPHAEKDEWTAGNKHHVWYHCMADGPHKGYAVKSKYWLPCVPAWCPVMEKKGVVV